MASASHSSTTSTSRRARTGSVRENTVKATVADQIAQSVQSTSNLIHLMQQSSPSHVSILSLYFFFKIFSLCIILVNFGFNFHVKYEFDSSFRCSWSDLNVFCFCCYLIVRKMMEVRFYICSHYAN